MSPLKANRYLSGDEVRSSAVWENIKNQMIQTPYGFFVFDDTVIDKNFSRRKGFPAGHKVKVFRVVLSTQRTDYVVTNEMEQDNAEVVHTVCGFRWKVEQFHRETKQLTGIEGNQCRKARLIRNHIGCAILVWIRLRHVAVETNRTIYRVKYDLLDDYLRQQLKSPSVQICFA
jgi:hypothetical protein